VMRARRYIRDRWGTRSSSRSGWGIHLPGGPGYEARLPRCFGPFVRTAAGRRERREETSIRSTTENEGGYSADESKTDLLAGRAGPGPPDPEKVRFFCFFYY